MNPITQTPAIQPQWNLPEGVDKFSEGHVYHAYRTGISEGEQKDFKLFARQLELNGAQAAKDTFSAINIMKEMGIVAISAHLKIVSRYSVKVLITVSDNDFIKDAFETLYAKIHGLQESSKNDLYSITFTFINRSKEFDIDMVKLDGFTSTFKPLEKEAK